MKFRLFNSVPIFNMIILALFCIYAGHILYNVWLNNAKRRFVKVGDFCSVYIGERKLKGFVIKVNAEVDILVLDRIFRIKRNQLYA